MKMLAHNSLSAIYAMMTRMGKKRRVIAASQTSMTLGEDTEKVIKQDFLHDFQGSGIEKVNKQDLLQVF